MEKTKRYFNAYLVNDDNEETKIHLGKFSGKVPKQVAGKAYSVAIKKYEQTECFTVKLCIREIINGCDDKSYYYNASKIKLPCPEIIELPNGKTIEYHYKNEIIKCS
jgi:hypothetical protein